MIDALQIQSLEKTYPNGMHALKGINLSVKSGEFLGLLGPNGAGKSTTISIISSLVKKTRGEVFVYGYEIEREPSAAKAHIGVVPQEFNFSIFEKIQNILMDQAGYYGIRRNDAKIRAKKYLTLLELWDKRHQPARHLSGGMKRRLMIARALMHEPNILILDEPTAGVDVEIRRSMWAFLRELNKAGKTIILTTHYLEEAEQLCDRIAIIQHGKIIHDLPKKNLLGMLNVEKFILDLRCALTQTLPKFPGFEIVQKDSHTIEVLCEKTQNLNALFDFLSQHQIAISSMRNETNRLEALFLNLTASQA